MKKNGANFVINMACGSLSHITEKARVVTAWKQANVMSEIKLQTDVAARAHGQPVTMLPCDWDFTYDRSSGRATANKFQMNSC